MVNPHVLVVTYPAQGIINPSLQFAKRLLSIGCRVTYATTVFTYRRMIKGSIPQGLSFATFSDGYDDEMFKPGPGNSIEDYFLEMRLRGSEILTQLIISHEKEGDPFTCLVYTTLLPWVASMSRELRLPSALLWVQPATVFDIYYYCFNGYHDIVNDNDPSCLIKLPGLPLLTGRDLPSFLKASNTYAFALPTFEEHTKELVSKGTTPKVVVNTFDALESEALKAIQEIDMIGIGPLIPSAFLDEKNMSDTSFGGDLFQISMHYKEWLNSRPESSVIYVSFGSISELSMPQMEEIACGLLDTGHPFLWVIREKENGEEKKEEHKLSCMEELEKQGMIVPWCSQLEVLSHKAIGCFITHCGWNSTLESLVCGVPVVGFPQWTDQTTNAKLVEDEWKTGVRLNANQKGLVESDEIRRCLEIVMRSEERGKEMRRNAKKWKDLAREAIKEGGSSDKNLKAFVNEVEQARHQ